MQNFVLLKSKFTIDMLNHIVEILFIRFIASNVFREVDCIELDTL